MLFNCFRPRYALALLAMLMMFITYGQNARVVITGNTADLKKGDEVFELIASSCRNDSTPVLWTFNGDIFPLNVSDEQVIAWGVKIQKILQEYSNLQIVITQGERDWDNSGKKGWKKIQSLQKLLDQNKHERLHTFIDSGCPGPWTFDFTSEVRILAINTQWWNHPYEKPLPGSDDCDIADTDIFIEELEGVLDESANKNVMLLTHFPFQSLGHKAGRFPVSTYVLPPIVGSAIAGFHQNVGNPSDINNDRFGQIRYRIEGMLQNYSSVIVASAHESNHSVIKASQNFYVNSGALDGGSFVAHSNQALFRSVRDGYIEIDYQQSGEVGYRFQQRESKNLNARGILFYSACNADNLQPKNNSFKPCPDKHSETVTTTSHVLKSTKAVAGEEYSSGKFKQAWLGKHYRASWTTAIDAPLLNMDTTAGGLTVIGKGGGRQTTSLKLSGRDGNEYVFRSVNKDPSKALPYELRGTIVSDVLKDQTTTQHPFGAIAVAFWLNKLNVLHATPMLYVLPDDEALGQFRESYKNLFGMLEARPTDKVEQSKIFGGAKDIEKSFKMFDKLYHDHDNRVVQHDFLKARLFDIWIGDWSKHEDNWKWAGYKDETGEYFRPIPRDRDHSFSRWDGIIPWLADREWAMPNGENFDTKVKGLRSLVWQARHLDRFVANEATRNDWVEAAKEIESVISTTDIEDGIRKMPKEVYEPDGKEIEAKLKRRIVDLPTYASRYYDMLAREVDVIGSNKKEYFQVKRYANGEVKVMVFDLTNEKGPDTSKVYYNRLFLPKETREIRLFGLREDDVFNIEGDSKHSILVRIIGGDGHDIITDNSNVSKGASRTLVYDKEKHSEIAGKELKRVYPKEPALYQYDRHAFKYNTYLPIALLTYNPFTGFGIQGGIDFTRQRFDKPGFSSKHQVKGSVTTQGNYEISYSNQFRYIVGKWDGVGSVVLSRPLNYNFFFGVGNDTKQELDRPKNYHRTQYNMAAVSMGLQRSFFGTSSLAVTASYELDEGITRNNSYLKDHPEVFGIKQLHLVFVNALLDLDFRDRPALSEHGFRFYVMQSAGHVSGLSRNIASITEGKIENYFSTYSRNPFTVGVQLGAGTTHGDLPFYKLLSLGQLNNLQGFKRNRFTGESKAYLNTELRFQITQTRNTFVPLKIGVRGFYDVGRVWAAHDPDDANYWHQGYGGGFYITPFREQFAFNISAGSSKEESLLLMISVGSFFR